MARGQRKDIDGSESVPCFYGKELRFQREEAGLTLEQLVEGSFYGTTYLSEIERGQRRMPPDLARHVDRVLKTDGYFERGCDDVRKARKGGHAEYFADVAEMEKFARTIEEWAPLLVPGLLQTADYARAIVRAGVPRADDAYVQKNVTARLGRATIFRKEEPPAFWAILDESVIRRAVLPPEEMAELLEHIAGVTRATRSLLQIVPTSAVTHPFMMGMAKIMTFADAPPVAYTESLHSGQLIDDPRLVQHYRESYDLLRAVALPPETSLAMVEAAAEDYRNGTQQR
ncbi:helix-turn-helix transcriptional regulator [Streptomyces sp. TRM76323]|uniref:Helix-turn-helix transcriptional regulator n=1 Tax=Streptomyces tamarix TaxID=3078565 RepID=A0ABU3QH89_9ACTN|nr:helix-turn-helix transcriptional regulator [Streptomyces tamarix]MDT9682127.1 helix-turn-helix transcriptional regulator [Streptomyces tamarix]